MLRGHAQKPAVTQEASVLVVGSNESRTDGIIFSGTVQIDGRTEGDIRCNRLVVTRHGRIDGAVSTHSVTIDGTVNGPIDAARIFLGPTAVIKGNLTYEALNVATGASITGFCRDRVWLTARASGGAALSGLPVLAFNLARAACGKIKPAARSANPLPGCHAVAGSMKAVWNSYQRNIGSNDPTGGPPRSIASLAAAYDGPS
jgi:cytoskeletal protein CcmA (bactofilin family)